MANRIINVTVSAVKPQSVAVNSNQTKNEITATGDLGLYYSQIAKKWANGEGMVEDGEYSAKHYATEAKEHSITSSESATKAQEIIDTAINDIDEAKDNAILDITDKASLSVGYIEERAESFLTIIEETGERNSDNLNEISTSATTTIENLRNESLTTIQTTANQALEDIEKESADILDFKEDVSKELEGKVDSADMVPIGFSEVPCIVETYQNGTSWYYVRSDGWCEQGGRVARSTNDMTISLLKTMTNTDYSILRSEIGAVKNQYDSVIHNITTTSFKVYCGMTTSEKTEIIWEAKGYIA